MSAYSHLRLESDGPVARITLARPEVRNAFDETLIAELTQALGGIAGSFQTDPDQAPRALVLTGEGNVMSDRLTSSEIEGRGFC